MTFEYLPESIQNDSPSHGHRGSPHSIRQVPLPPIYYHSANVKEEKRHRSLPSFLLASMDVAAQSASAPVAASLAREITQPCEDVAKHKVTMVSQEQLF